MSNPFDNIPDLVPSLKYRYEHIRKIAIEYNLKLKLNNTIVSYTFDYVTMACREQVDRIIDIEKMNISDFIHGENYDFGQYHEREDHEFYQFMDLLRFLREDHHDIYYLRR